MVEDVLVNRNVRFSMEIMDEVCGVLSTSDGIQHVDMILYGLLLQLGVDLL